jgi:hypothetical protein
LERLGWSNWEELGGSFTSPPVVLPATAGAYDIFARGPDFLVYYANWKASSPPVWAPLGGGLLGEPRAASTPAVIRVHSGAFVFVAAGDGSIWYTFSDGVVWKAWNSLGPAYKAGSGKAAIRFISEPVVAAFFPNSDVTFGIPPGVGGISTGVAPPPAGTGSGPPPPATVISGHVRVDVFAVGEDNALWHKWLTDGAWHGELNGDLETGNWSQVPGASLACAPSLLSFNRGETVISMPPVAIQMAVAYTDGTIHLWSFDGTIFSDLYNGPNLNFRLPCTYSFSLDTVEIDNTKSRLKDTDLAVGALAVATWPVRTASFSMGRVDNGTYHYSDRVLIGPITVELCEPLIVTYSIVNKSDSDTSVNVAKAVIATVQKGTEDYVNDLVKDGKITFSGSLEGATFAALLDLAVSEIEANLFENCDGVVVADSKNFFRGRAIQELVATAGVAGKFTSTAQYVGTEDPGDCEISNYKVSVSISQH